MENDTLSPEVLAMANIAKAGRLIAESLMLGSSLTPTQENLNNSILMAFGLAVRKLKKEGYEVSVVSNLN